jgi:hypothetical protein
LGKEKVALLNIILRSKSGDDLFNTHRKLKDILLKGKIEKISECKIIFEYLEDIFDYKSRQEEIKELNLCSKTIKEKPGKYSIPKLPSFPSVNRPISYFDSGKIKCDCGQ